MATYTDTVPLAENDQFSDIKPPPYGGSTTMQPPPAPAPQAVQRQAYPAMQASSQSSNNNVVVVGSQPTQLPPVTVREPSLRPGEKTLILSLVLFALCSLTCQIWALFCLVPGLIFAVVGFNLRHSKDKQQCAGGFNGVSLCCSVTTVCSFVITVVCLILYHSIFFGAASRNSCSCYNSCDSYGRCSTVCC